MKSEKAHLMNYPPSVDMPLSPTLCGRVARHESKPDWWGVTGVLWKVWNKLPRVAQCGTCRARDPFGKRIDPPRCATVDEMTAVEVGLIGASRAWPADLASKERG